MEILATTPRFFLSLSLLTSTPELLTLGFRVWGPGFRASGLSGAWGVEGVQAFGASELVFA